MGTSHVALGAILGLAVPGYTLSAETNRPSPIEGSFAANRRQGELDPASWLPANPEAARWLVVDRVEIKASRDPSLDEAERLTVDARLEPGDDRAVSVMQP